MAYFSVNALRDGLTARQSKAPSVSLGYEKQSGSGENYALDWTPYEDGSFQYSIPGDPQNTSYKLWDYGGTGLPGQGDKLPGRYALSGNYDVGGNGLRGRDWYDENFNYLTSDTWKREGSMADGLKIASILALPFAVGGAQALMGTGAGGAAGGSGAFLGEGVASGIPAWDAAAGLSGLEAAGVGGSGAFLGEGVASGIPAWDAAGFAIPEGAAFTPATAAEMTAMGASGAGGGGLMSQISSAATKLFGGGGAGGASSGFNWSNLIGPAISAIGGAYSAGQAKDAAEIQAQAAREAQAQFKPWIDAGGKAITDASNMINGQGFTTSPDYQWRLSEGQKALERARSASGSLGSGRFLKDLTDYNQNQASGEFTNALNRRLAVAGMGQTATGSAADYLTQGANASAAGKVGSANALMTAIGNGWSMYQNGQQRDQNNMLMDYLLRRG